MTTKHQSSSLLSSDESQSNSEVACAEYSIRNASVNSWPYRHALIRPVFSAQYYNEIINAFPEDDAFTPLSNHYPNRGHSF